MSIAYEHLEFKDKYATIEESYVHHKEQMKPLIISKRDEGFAVFSLTRTFTGIKGRTKHWIERFLDPIQDLFHRDKINKLIGSGWIYTMWRKLKFEGMRYCHDLDIRPIVTTLDKSIDYQAAFIQNPDYNQYIKDKQTPFFLKCYDSKVKQSSTFNTNNACRLEEEYIPNLN